MDISKLQKQEIISLIEKRIKNKSFELEVRLCGRQFDKKFSNIELNQIKFQNIIQYLTYSKDNNGLGLKYKMETTLDINLNNSDIRLTLDNQNTIKRYWLEGILEKNYTILKKNLIKRFDIDNYSLRFSLSNEETIDIDKFSNDISYKEKHFRYKNRYSILSEDNLWRFDFSEVRQATGTLLSDTDIFKKPIEYEIELEYIGESKESKQIFDKLFNNIGILLSLYQNSKHITSNEEYNDILNYYSNLFKTNKFVAASPVTLHVKNLLKKTKNNILTDYVVTYKADGERYLAIVLPSKKHQGEIYLINNNFQVIKTGICVKEYVGTIVEGEYISDSNTFYVYDILMYKNKDMRKLPLIGKHSRVSHIQMFLLHVKGDMKFIEKKYVTEGDDIFESTKKQLEQKDIKMDGLIYTPIKLEYPNKGGTWSELYKWKPPKYNSIDFLVYIHKENMIEVTYPYVYDKKEATDYNMFQYKIAYLQVSSYREKHNKNLNKRIKTCVPTNFCPPDDKEAYKVYIPLIDGHMYAIDKENNTRHLIKDRMIVEFSYNLNEKDKYFRWKPIRVRYDKTLKYQKGEPMFGNFESVANNIWLSIKHPVTQYMLTSGDVKEEDVVEVKNEYYNNTTYNADPKKRLSYQKFHTLFIKRGLIHKAVQIAGNEKLLDVGYGKLGDMPSWKANDVKFIFGFDSNMNNLDLATEIYKETVKPKPNVILVHGDFGKLIYPDYRAGLDETAKTLMNTYLLAKNQFDIVSCQFALTYFYDNEITIRTFLQNVSDSLKIGGCLITTCFDGKRVMELLTKKSIEGKNGDNMIWKIEKDYRSFKFDANKPNYNKKIKVYVSSIGNPFIENLVNIEYFVKLAKEYKLELVENNSFEKLYGLMSSESNYNNISKNMSEAEKQFSFLNTALIFKKTEPSPVILYTKLKKKIDKK